MRTNTNKACHLLLSLALAAPSIGSAAEVQMSTEVYTVEPSKPLAKRETASPGDEIIIAEEGTELQYVIVYTSGEPVPANITIVNEIPPTLRYVTGAGDLALGRFEVSVDRGRTFGHLPGLEVITAGGPRKATRDDVTTVRWSSTFPVDPGHAGSVSLRTQVR